ncbi:MAG: sigma factor-like helix-turn-helix DNA-binding protein [Thermoleophilia bacterium]
MGVMNTRAICPNCGGKIHTQPRGLGHFTWARSGWLVQTGKQCQWCGIALTGKVGLDNKAISVAGAQAKQQKKTQKMAARQQKQNVQRLKLNEQHQAMINLIKDSPLPLEEVAKQLGISRNQVKVILNHGLRKRVSVKGSGKDCMLSLKESQDKKDKKSKGWIDAAIPPQDAQK